MAAISENVTRYICCPGESGRRELKSLGMKGWRQLRDKAPDWDATLFSLADADAKARRLTETTGIEFYATEYSEV